VARCDAADGLRDGLIGDPRRCDFDPAVLACGTDATNTCLTPEQVSAVRKVYAGARNARTGAQLFPGWVRGSEEGWGPYILDPREPVRLGLFRFFTFHDPAWDWRTFDWDRDVNFVEAQVPYLSAVSRDLQAFSSRGGKLLMYTGWADPVVPPEDIVSYYEAVARTQGGLRKTQQFFRFFAVPGMGHCGGGSGPNSFDTLSALEAWVEHGRAPERLIAAHSVNGKIDRTRPLCAYPGVARYSGNGSIESAQNFRCAVPRR
jgi:feruloyl esterase